MKPERTNQRNLPAWFATTRHRQSVGWILIATLAFFSAPVSGQGSLLSVAEQMVEQGRHYLEKRQYELAEQALQQALQAVDSVDAADHARNRAVRMQCLRLLSRDCYPQMGRSAMPKALEAGRRYQKLLSSHSQAIPRPNDIRDRCENGLHLAGLHLALGQDQAAEELLQQLTTPKYDPMLELDLWLTRTKVARRLAAADSDREDRPQWNAAAARRWSRVEASTRIALQQIAQDPLRLRQLAVHYRTGIAGPRDVDLAITRLRETLLEHAKKGGHNAVLTLARVSAHEDHLPRARQLTKELLEHSQASPTANPVFTGQLLSQIGGLEAASGNIETAEAYYQRVLEIVPRHSLSPREPREATRGQALLARTHDELGQVAAAQGDYAAADSHYKQALHDWRELSAQQDWHATALQGLTRSLLHRLSLKKMQESDHSDLLEQYETVRDFMEENCGSNHPDLIELYCLLANAYLARPTEAHLRQAGDCCRKACQIARTCGDRPGERQARYYLTLVLLEQGRRLQFRGDTRKADDSLTKASNICEALLTENPKGNSLWEARIHRCLGDVHYLRRQFATGEREYRKAIDRFQNTTALPMDRFNAQIGLARVLEKQDRLPEATDCLQSSLQIVDLAAATLPGSRQQQLAFYERFGEAYDLLVQCLLEQNRPEEMLCFAECLRNRMLQDELRCLDGRTNPVQSLPRNKRIEFAKCRQSLRELYQIERDEGRLAPRTLRLRIAEDEKRIVRLWHEALAATPSFAALLPPLQHATAEARTIQQLTPTEDAPTEDIVLYYYLGNRRSYLIVIAGQTAPRYYPLTITPQQSRVLFRHPMQTTVGLTRSMAERLVNAYIDLIQFSSTEIRRATTSEHQLASNIAKADPAPEKPRPGPGRVVRLGKLQPRKGYSLRAFGAEQAYVLSNLLLPEAVVSQIRQQPLRYQHTIIVADPYLQSLPFAALPIRSPTRRSSPPDGPKYVLNLFPPICYAPSLQVLDLLHSRSRHRVPANRVVAIGAVSPELKHARQECQLVAQHFADQIVTPLLVGPRATKGLLMRYAQECRLLYFADHAEVRPTADNITGGLTLFRRPSRGRHLDAVTATSWPDTNRGDLALPEILRLNLQGCEAALLFSCSTQRGSPTRLDNGQSLARAFLVAGASRVIATFWDVPDRVPRPIVQRLLSNIKRRADAGEKVDYAHVLKEAMEDTQRNTNTSEPNWWAPFALVGPPVAHSRWISPSANPPKTVAMTTRNRATPKRDRWVQLRNADRSLDP